MFFALVNCWSKVIMNTSYSRMQALLLTIPSVAVLLTCNTVDAQVYKWRDNRGVIQYSDKPPVAGFTKASRNEIVNALQKKDLCAEPTAKTAALASATKKISANFFGATPSSGFGLYSQPVTTFGISVAPKSVVVATAPKPVVVATAPKPVPVAIAPTPAPAPSPSVGANIIQVALMPAVDINKNIAPEAGFSSMRIQSTSEQATSNDIGAFRLSCFVSHMSNDDPMVYPNQQGAAHHHTFYGNTSVNYKSDLNNLANVGNSTCQGGTMNRSAYWHPTIIDSSTNAPVLPDGNEAGFYYKTGYSGVAPSAVKAPPKGLRMLVGNPKATSADQVEAVKYVCMNPATQDSDGMPWQKAIPNCKVGHWLQMVVGFPQCWDGKNLDSPNHKDHMAYPSGGCPASHPVPIPEISLNMRYTVKTANQALNWRLASDNYAKNGANAGYSGHADWVNGWDEATMAGIVRNCLNPSKDAKAYLLCDGRMFN